MARKGNHRKNGLDGSTSTHKKGLQSGSAMPHKKGKGSVSNMKVVKEELPSDTQPSIPVTEPLHKSDHIRDDKKRTNKSGKHNKVDIRGTSAAEQSEPCDGTSEDCSTNMSTTGSCCLEEEKWASANGTPGSKNRKRRSGRSLSCLNENPAPPRQSKGKKKVNDESSSRSLMRDTLSSYMAEKLSLLKAQLEVQRKKDEKYFKFLEGENMKRDMRFVMYPHENIPDPTFKQFIINKKREICEKWGWPCSL